MKPTLSTLAEFTNQQIFDFVGKHLIKQGEASINVGKCKYRVNKNGKDLSCAIGCLISDENYEEIFEGKAVASLLGYNSFNQKITDESKIQFLTSLQYLHDYETDWDNIPKSLELFAEENNLNYETNTRNIK